MQRTDLSLVGVTLLALLAGLMSAPAQTNIAAPAVRVLLLGDSTCAGSVPRTVAPKADQLEDVIRKLLAAQPDLPPAEVINRGINGGTVKLFLDHYATCISQLPGGKFDFIFLRFGVNDVYALTNFSAEFPVLYHEFVTKLRNDNPQAHLTIETVIPYQGGELTVKANEALRKIAETEKLPVLDICARFTKELALQGPNALTYRHVAWADIPAPKHSLFPAEWRTADGKYVIILDNTLDAHFRDLPRWFADRHPNLAGYHVIGDEIAKYLAPLIRARADTSK